MWILESGLDLILDSLATFWGEPDLVTTTVASPPSPAIWRDYIVDNDDDNGDNGDNDDDNVDNDRNGDNNDVTNGEWKL